MASEASGLHQGFGVETKPPTWWASWFGGGVTVTEGKWKNRKYKGALVKQAGKGLQAQINAQAAAAESEAKFTEAEGHAFNGVAAGGFAMADNDKKSKEMKAAQKISDAKQRALEYASLQHPIN